MAVFSSSSASGENSGLPLAVIFFKLYEAAGSACRSEVVEGLRLGMHGKTTDTGAAVLGDKGATRNGGGQESEDVWKKLVAAAVKGAAALVFIPMLLSPNDTQRGRVSADEEWSNTGWLGGDGGGWSQEVVPTLIDRNIGMEAPNLAEWRGNDEVLRPAAGVSQPV